ncbi:hypothetical protein QYE76_040943 [Lolium multiflorum]|uniref:CCHC-type domain-containing protein n=1 Tax=Lolium multiflorum TaxID=4521 RepID=A0AAD8TCI6_LOLMU|nr:hypothetical protein QYE76_040943 [Lolium multiflorum]
MWRLSGGFLRLRLLPQAGEIDNLTVSLGQSTLVVLCRFHVGAGIPGVAPHYISPPSTFKVLLGSYWFDKPWFHTEGNLLLYASYLPLGVPNGRVHLRVSVVDPEKNKRARAYLLGALSEDILLQVSSKKTAAAIWECLKARFVGADRVKAARLSMLRGEFDRLIMADDEELDVYAGKICCMAAKFASLGRTLSDAQMVKKLRDTVPESLFAAVAGIEQFCDVETICFDEVLGRLKAFQERTERRKAAVGGERHGDQLLLTAAQWEQRLRGGGYDDGGDNNGRRGKCHNCGIRGHFARDCPKKKQVEENQEEALLCNVDDHPCLL